MKYIQLACFLSLFFIGSLFHGLAQEGKAGFDPDNYSGTPNILQSASSSIDRLISLEGKLGLTPEDWKSYYRGSKGMEFDVDKVTEDSRRCVLLGVKVADGVLALKARDAETLNDCATYIEKLAKALDVPEESLDGGFKIKDAVNRGDWFDAFFQLGMYRQEIMRALQAADGNDRSKAILIVCGGWFHGADLAVNVINKNYDPEMTNDLRSQRFVDLMIAEVKTIEREDLRNSNEIKYLLEALPKIRVIVDIEQDWKIAEGQIPKETLTRLRKIANGLTATAMSGVLIPVK